MRARVRVRVRVRVSPNPNLDAVLGQSEHEQARRAMDGLVRRLERRAEHPRPEAVAVADDEVGCVERGVVDDPVDALVRGAQRRRLFRVRARLG